LKIKQRAVRVGIDLFMTKPVALKEVRKRGTLMGIVEVVRYGRSLNSHHNAKEVKTAYRILTSGVL
jgi:hypothetical protein